MMSAWVVYVVAVLMTGAAVGLVVALRKHRGRNGNGNGKSSQPTAPPPSTSCSGCRAADNGPSTTGVIVNSADISAGAPAGIINRPLAGNSMTVVDNSGQPLPLYDTVEQQSNFELFFFKLEDTKVYAVPFPSSQSAIARPRHAEPDPEAAVQPVYHVTANSDYHPEYHRAIPGTSDSDATPVYRVLGKPRYGRSDHVHLAATSISYDRLQTGDARTAGDGGYLTIMSGVDVPEMATDAVPIEKKRKKIDTSICRCGRACRWYRHGWQPTCHRPNDGNTDVRSC